MARVVTNNLGPGIIPFSIADLMPTSASWAPSVPRSRSVVKPLSKLARAWMVALLMRSATGSFDTWSSHFASSYGCNNKWEWASISPGVSVVPERKRIWALVGGLKLVFGPAKMIFSPCIATTHPSWMEETPSKTLSGCKTVTGSACRARIEKNKVSKNKTF